MDSTHTERNSILNAKWNERRRDLERFYRSLRTLEAGLGCKRLMSSCTGQNGWPNAGVYFFFEPGEIRADKSGPRVVRVGTHRVSRDSKTTLWNRLRTHRGTGGGGGNHRSSIFRLHVGAALAGKDATLTLRSWKTRQAVNVDTRRGEEALERRVSQHLGTMSLLWLSIADDAGPASDRAYMERNAIGLIVDGADPVDLPSEKWLGRFSPDDRIKNSGMWNLDHLGYPYSRDFLDVFDEYVSITIGRKSQPTGSRAPSGWYERQGVT